ncbi:hypothetical protein [Synechococcus sp. BA-124 BA4]|nr:hypothetical protein [Synechococcus sp. BA-124 BA4]
MPGFAPAQKAAGGSADPLALSAVAGQAIPAQSGLLIRWSACISMVASC